MRLWIIGTYCVLVLLVAQETSAFDDTTLQLALEVVDKAVVQTLFKREGNQELLNYINKYRQLISQAIRIIKKINLKNWSKVKNILERLKIPLPKFSFDKNNFIEKLRRFGFNQEKIKMYMPKFSKNIEVIQQKLSSVGINEERLNKVRSTMSDAMYLMSKVYSVFVYTNMLLKGAAFSQVFSRTAQPTITATDQAIAA